MLKPEGKGTDTWNPNGAVKSLELLGKFHGINGFSSDVNVSLQTALQINIHLGVSNDESIDTEAAPASETSSD